MLTNLSQLNQSTYVPVSRFSQNLPMNLTFAGLRDLQPVASPDPVNVLGEYQCDTFFIRDLR
ncbi:MAG: hypothetical protein K2X66_18515, partial [Cyanobacteria bacterium]|nr:hypothetical protein [Cyanobacteriota bacterium]